MEDLQTLLNWFITSSSDPKKTSLAVIGVLTVSSGYLLTAVQLACTVGLTCLPIDAGTVNDAINAFGAFVEGALMIVGAILFVAGLMRKLYHGRWTAAQ